MTAATHRVSLLGTSALLFEAPGETELADAAADLVARPRGRDLAGGPRGGAGRQQPARQLRRAAAPSRCARDASASTAWQAAAPLAARWSRRRTAGRLWRRGRTAHGGRRGPHGALRSTRSSAIHCSTDLSGLRARQPPGLLLPRRHGPAHRDAPAQGAGAQAFRAARSRSAGAQTGVSASDGPSGWNTIGSTSMRFFDATRDPPALLQPGDSIAFRVAGVIR